MQTYALPRVPVVLTDAIAKWNALKTWTPEYLREKVGNNNVSFYEGEGLFGEFADQILASTPGNPSMYMLNVYIQGQLPEIYLDVLPRIQYAQPDWKSSWLMPKD